MRITNVMTNNQLILNLNKSMTSLSFLQYQAETGNKIRFASDNPIIAGRSLKFRTSIVETEQYLANIDQGRAWIKTTGNAVENIMEAFVNSGQNSLRSLLVSAGGVNTIEDSKIYANQISQTLSDIMGELNTSYAGRYVFSGFKTDEKPVFDVDNPTMTADIKQTFSFDEIDDDFRVFVTDAMGMPEEVSCNRIKLAYENAKEIDVTLNNPTPTSVMNSTDAGAYQPGPNDVIFLWDTGEIIFGDDAYDALDPDGVEVKYEKTGFLKGDINPKAYFETTVAGEPFSVIDGQTIMFEFGISNRMQVNTFAKDMVTTSMLNDVRDVVSLLENIKLSDRDELVGKYMAASPGPNMSQADAEAAADRQLQDEEKFYTEFIGRKFTELIGKVDKHSTVVSEENTALGSRLSRLDLMSNRLQDDRVNFEDLKAENDYVDAAETYIRYQSMLAVYQSALQTGAGILKMSLVNFI